MLNNYFVNELKFDNLHDSSKYNYTIYENQMYKNQNKVRLEFKFRFVETVIMEKVVSSRKNKNSFGFDDTQIKVIKSAEQSLSEILCHLKS